MPSPQRITIPFVGGTAVARSVAVINAATINFMQAMKGRGAKAPVILETCPGVEFLNTVGDGPLRTPQMVQSAIRGSGFDLYGVYGSKLVAQNPDSSNTEVGSLDSVAGRVSIVRGRDYVACVDGSNCYTYDGTTFAKVSDLDLPSNPTHIIYIDGFFLVNDATTDNFYLSALEDPTSWNALDFEAAAVAPDRALALAATSSLLWALGEESAQPYFNSGNADFPYTLSLEGVKPVGVLAPHSVATSVDGIFYLATTPQGGRFVYRLQGTSGQIVTGDEQEALLDKVLDPGDAYGFVYRQGGKSFYVLQLSATADKSSITMVYNISAGSWETREMQDGSAWRVAGHGIMDNRNVAGSRLGNQQLELSLDNYQDVGEELIRTRRTEIYHTNNLAMDWLEVGFDIEGGVGNFSSPGQDPVLRFRYSDDYGRTWSRWLKHSMGKQGEFKKRVVFRKLGQSHARQLEVSSSAATSLTIIGAYARVQVLED